MRRTILFGLVAAMLGTAAVAGSAETRLEDCSEYYGCCSVEGQACLVIYVDHGCSDSDDCPGWSECCPTVPGDGDQ